MPRKTTIPAPKAKKATKPAKAEIKTAKTNTRLNEKYGLDLAAHHAECAHRIRVLIKMSTFHQAMFARMVGISVTQVNNITQGISRPSVDAAIAIIRAMPGVTLDYIYLGNKSGLSLAASQAITKAEAQLDSGRDA